MAEYKTRWRVVYMRSMYERKKRGWSDKEALDFFNDKEVRHSYTAILEYKILPGAPWIPFAHIFINKGKTSYTLIGEDGRIMNLNPIDKETILSTLRENPSPNDFYHYLGKL